MENRLWTTDELISQGDPKEFQEKSIKLVTFRYHRIGL